MSIKHYKIDIQKASKHPIPIANKIIKIWVSKTLAIQDRPYELTLRFVDIEEITTLNFQYRQINKPTNVLAFPCDIPNNIPLPIPFLGDIVVCPEILQIESKTLNVPLTSHWAHIIIHGVLHLLGYDHINEEDALKMQALEIELLATFGIMNPYNEVKY